MRCYTQSLKEKTCDLQDKVYENRWENDKTNKYFEASQKLVVFWINDVPGLTSAPQMCLTLVIIRIAVVIR